MFSMAGVPKDAALGVSLIYLSVIYLVSLLGGFFLILRSVKTYRYQKTTGFFSELRKKGLKIETEKTDELEDK